jgi:phage FluMu protein Com
MAGPAIKFRCHHCNQLLGVSRSKAGRVVNCPKCKNGLVVPDPDEGPAPAEAPAGSESTPAFLAALDAGMPIELADIRPEDIRAEPGEEWRPLPIDTGPPGPAPAPFLAPGGGAGDPGRTYPLDLETAPTPLVDVVAPAAAVPSAGAAGGLSRAEPVVPPIRLAAPTLVVDRTAPVRGRDLVLSRTVVASWSLFVLMAQALAFFAGLLAGHFLWRVH